jgi:hypothetical protein
VAATFDSEVDVVLLGPEQSSTDILGISRHDHDSLSSDRQNDACLEVRVIRIPLV